MDELSPPEQVQKAYLSLAELLDSIPQIIEKGETSPESSVLWDLADRMEDLSKLLVPQFRNLARLRALANQITKPGIIEISDAWVAEVVAEIGLGLVQWLRETACYLDRHSGAAAGKLHLNILEKRRPQTPFVLSQIDACRDLMLNEEAFLCMALKGAESQQTESPPDPVVLAKAWLDRPRKLHGPTKDQKTFLTIIINGDGFASHQDLSKDGGFQWEDHRQGAKKMAQRINKTIAKTEGWHIIPEDASGCRIVLNVSLEVP